MTAVRSRRPAVSTAFANLRNTFTDSSPVTGSRRDARRAATSARELCMERPDHTLIGQLQDLAHAAFRGLADELNSYTDELHHSLSQQLDAIDQLRQVLADKTAGIADREQRCQADRESLDQAVLENETLRRKYQAAIDEATVREQELLQLAAYQQRQDDLGLINQTLERKCSEQQSHVNDLQRELEAIRSQATRFANVAIDLADARATILELREELAAARSADVGADVAQLQQLLQERTELELELETVRARAAQLSEEAEAERCRMDDQRAQWAAEMRQLRRSLEAHSQACGDLVPNDQLTRAVGTPPPVQLAAASAPRTNKDPVLDAVMAQFQQLQKDRVQRRGAAAVSGKQEVA